jgi:AcrR family transcriptional regulator
MIGVRGMEQSNPLGKRELILEAAAQVFSQNGFHRSTVEEIAQRAGVGKGTIYEYFSSKKELFQQLVVGRVERLMMELLTRVEQADNAKDKMRVIMDATLSHFIRVEQINKILLIETSAAEDAKMRNILLKKREALTDLISKIIQQGIDQGEFRPVDSGSSAKLFVGFMNELIFSALLCGCGNQLDPEVAMDLFFYGLAL